MHNFGFLVYPGRYELYDKNEEIASRATKLFVIHYLYFNGLI